MTLLACCLYLLLIALVGYTVISAIHASNRMTIVQLIGLGPAVGAGNHGFIAVLDVIDRVHALAERIGIIGILTLASLLVMKKKPPAGTDKDSGH